MAFFGKPTCKGTLKASSIIALVFLVASCTDNKVSQCNKLIEVANRAVTEVQAVTQTANPNPDNVGAMSKIADAADKAKTDMGDLKVSDDKLKGFQTRFITMYTDTSKATRDLVTAANAKDAESAQKSFNALKTATDQEAPLVNEVNTYCTAK